MLFSDQHLGTLKNETYGQELILDIHDVPPEFFESKLIKKFSEDLCDEIKMKRGPNYVWGDDKSLGTMHNPKADGISCIQFLYTSSITIHAIDELQKVFVNIFSCHDFDAEVAKNFVLKNVGGQLASFTNLKRR
jgi:S-adenosylmethionine/arginine decarboxylase-like enzyme